MATSKRAKRNAQKSTELAPQVPHYTNSLDASVPGENIIAVQFEEGSGKWIALNKDASGRVTIGVGNTEALARRIAALKAIQLSDVRPLDVTESEREQNFEKLIESLDKLCEAIEQNNEYAAKEPADRARRIAEVKSLRDLLISSKTLATATSGALLGVLVYLATKFVDSAIEKIADEAIKLIEKLLF